jgi:hypothetical protein
MNEPDLRYTKGMPITIAHIGQTGHLGGKLALSLESMDENAKKNSELKRSSSSLKAVGSIKRVE